MRLSKRTLNILTNYSMINQSIYIEKGNKLRTISEGKHIYSESDIPESFNEDFSIYDLRDFLKNCNIIEDAQLKIEKNICTIYNTNMEIEYMGANADLVDKSPNFKGFSDDPNIKFKLTKDHFSCMKDFLSMLTDKNIVINKKDDKLSLYCTEKSESSNKSPNKLTIMLEDYDVSGPDCEIIYDSNFLKVIHGDYNVEIYDNGRIKLYSDDIFYVLSPQDYIEI